MGLLLRIGAVFGFGLAAFLDAADETLGSLSPLGVVAIGLALLAASSMTKD